MKCNFFPFVKPVAKPHKIQHFKSQDSWDTNLTILECAETAVLYNIHLRKNHLLYWIVSNFWGNYFCPAFSKKAKYDGALCLAWSIRRFLGQMKIIIIVWKITEVVSIKGSSVLLNFDHLALKLWDHWILWNQRTNNFAFDCLAAKSHNTIEHYRWKITNTVMTWRHYRSHL